MRIAQIIDQISVGGAEVLQYSFANNLSEHDVDLSVVGMRLKSQELADLIINTGATIDIFEGDSLLDLKRWIPLFQFLRKNKFDVIHTHLNYGNIIGVICARLLGIPVVATLHSERMRERRHSGTLERFVLKWGTNRVIAVGNLVADAHRSWLGDSKLLVIPNAVAEIPKIPDDERILLRQELIGDPSRKLLISVGRFTQPKGYPDLVEAFAKIHAAFPDTRLVIVGDGELFTEINELVQQKYLQDVITLTGLRHDVPALLAASDLYINSSWWEGMSISVLEAMSAALPVVATDVGDTPNLVIHDTGLLVPSHQPDQLAQTTIELLNQPDKMRQLGENAHQHVMENYSVQVWVNRLLDLYREVIIEG
jgi:glycosyltransferase involved in cell wall biosynthesis